MSRPPALPIALGAAAVLAWLASQPPAARGPDAPATEFAAARALADIRVLAAQPHPLGSPAHEAAADYLLGRMRALGLEVRVQDAVEGGRPVRNLIGVLPGRERAAAPVALMAHYDTVPGSPGAADDSTGVACALEVARALRAGGAPRRDVALVITDGEEIDLLGARALYASDPLAPRLGAVLNMEARGGGGRVFMFETSEANGALIDLFRRVTPGPSSNSFAVFVYRHMPNDTDLTIVRAHGGAGLNYAFIGRQVDYHSPGSTVARLDARSVQHMGAQVLAMARALADADALPPRAPDRVYADILGLGVVAYAPARGWLVLAAAIALLAGAAQRLRAARLLAWRPLARGALAALLVLPLAAGLALLARRLTGIPHDFAGERPLLAAFGLYEFALAACGLGSAGLLAAWAGPRSPGAWLGALLPALLGAVAAQALVPAVAFLPAWPLLLAALGLAWLCRDPAAARATGPAAGWPVIVGAALAGAQCLYLAHAVLLSVGARLPAAAGLFAWLGAMSLFPLLQPARNRGRAAAAWTASILAGLALAAALRLV